MKLLMIYFCMFLTLVCASDSGLDTADEGNSSPTIPRIPARVPPIQVHHRSREPIEDSPPAAVANHPLPFSPLTCSTQTLNKAKSFGLSRSHIELIQQQLADEHAKEVTKSISMRPMCVSCAKGNELIATVAGYIAIAASPLAGATLLMSPEATNYIIFCGSICAITKIFCIGIAKYCLTQATEYQETLEELTEVTGLKSINTVPTIHTNEALPSS